MLSVTQLSGFGSRGGEGGSPQPGPDPGGNPEIGIVFNSNQPDYNIRNAALAAGWDGSSPVTINMTIQPGAVIWAGWPTNPALTTGSPWPEGSLINLVNNGEVRGAGGAGAGSGDNPDGGSLSRNGQAGGDAFANWGVPCNITNNGVFAGGGGGGGRGADRIQVGVTDPQTRSGRGGGGGAGDKPGDGNSGLFGAQDGTVWQGGAGGTASGSGTNFDPRAGDGGRGGDRGQPGQPGGQGQGGTIVTAAGSGGAAGLYARGDAHNNWLVTGTRLGGVAA